jgi:hypothetical protein
MSSSLVDEEMLTQRVLTMTARTPVGDSKEAYAMTMPRPTVDRLDGALVGAVRAPT